MSNPDPRHIEIMRRRQHAARLAFEAESLDLEARYQAALRRVSRRYLLALAAAQKGTVTA